MILFRRVALASFLLLLIFFSGCDAPPKVGDVLVPVATLKLDTPDAVMKLAVSPDGKKVAAILFRSSTMVVVWDVATKKIVYRLPHWYISYHSGISFTVHGDGLLTGDYVAYVDRLQKNAAGLVQKDHNGREIVRRLSPEEKFIGHLWNMTTGQKMKTFYYKENRKNVCWLSGAVFDRHGSVYYQPTQSGIKICDARTWVSKGVVKYSWFNKKGDLAEKNSATPYLGGVCGVIVDPTKGLALVAVEKRHPIKDKNKREETSIALVWFEMHTSHVIREAAVTSPSPGGYLDVRSMALSRDGRLAAISTNYGSGIWFPGGEEYKNIEQIKIFNTASGKLVTEIPYNDAAQAMTFGPDGQLLFVVNKDVAIWDVNTATEIGSFKDGRRIFSDIKLSRDGTTLVAGGGNIVYVWTVKQDKELQEGR